MSRLELKECLETALTRITELEATVCDFNGSEELLQARIISYLDELKRLQSLRSSADVEVPVELLRYLDEGGNPDVYTANTFRHSLESNQLSKGKVDAVRNFRNDVLDEAHKLFPEEAQAYSNLSSPSASSAAPDQAARGAS